MKLLPKEERCTERKLRPRGPDKGENVLLFSIIDAFEVAVGRTGAPRGVLSLNHFERSIRRLTAATVIEQNNDQHGLEIRQL